MSKDLKNREDTQHPVGRRVRRRKFLRIDQDKLLLILSGKIKTNNIPENSLIIAIQYDFFSGGLDIVIENEVFEPVGAGSSYPVILAEYSEI